MTRFGAHLPLSKNFNEVGDHGTRHTAALGLAEACDAFVIVVSEEQGTISTAHDGKLVEAESASDLKRRLETFWQVHYDMPPVAFLVERACRRRHSPPFWLCSRGFCSYSIRGSSTAR